MIKQAGERGQRSAADIYDASTGTLVYRNLATVKRTGCLSYFLVQEKFLLLALILYDPSTGLRRVFLHLRSSHQPQFQCLLRHFRSLDDPWNLTH